MGKGTTFRVLDGTAYTVIRNDGIAFWAVNENGDISTFVRDSIEFYIKYWKEQD